MEERSLVYQRKYRSRRHASDPIFRKKIRDYEKVARLMKVLVALKAGKVWEPLDCTPQEFIDHIEKQFKPGMSWDNYGKWVIDHREPICAGGTFYYLNLQPLWRKENQDKLTEDRKRRKPR